MKSCADVFSLMLKDRQTQHLVTLQHSKYCTLLYILCMCCMYVLPGFVSTVYVFVCGGVVCLCVLCILYCVC